MQLYSNPKRESDPYSLPDVEIWFHDGKGFARDFVDNDGEPYEPGWYYWACLPGCLPDSEPHGPFDTYDKAVADCRDQWNDDWEEEED